MVKCEMYQRLVGMLIYLPHSRPNVAHVINVVSQFTHFPREVHQELVSRILCYLKSTPRKGILFHKNEELSLEASTDAELIH